LKVLVTGAGGFLGKAVVSVCHAAGHDVVGLYRPASPPLATSLPKGVTMLFGDLRQPGPWCEGLAGIEAVVHCAAAASGDLPTQLAGTVLATENLLAALPSELKRFVHVSSFSVYDFDAPRWCGVLDENTPLESQPLRRDAYTQTKLIQERMVRQYCAGRNLPLDVLRPGAIYGPGKDWDYGRAMRLGSLDFIFAPFSRMRLVHVDNCADAAVAALAFAHDGEQIFNIVDDEQPAHWQYHRHARLAGAQVGLAVPVPYLCILGLGLMARIASGLFFRGRARLPELLDLPRQRARWRSLRYANSAVTGKLGWRPKISLRAALVRAI
jgi:nucleoside-diphosphate-sugar epimerase